MLTYNTMRFGTDKFTFANKKALLVAKNPISVGADFNYLDKFVLDYSQPEGSQIRFAFWEPYSYNTSKKNIMYLASGDIIQTIIVSNDPEEILEAVLEKGNTVDQLLSPIRQNIKIDFDIRPVIALEGEEGAIPRVKMGAVFSKRENVFTSTGTDAYNLDKPAKIISLEHVPVVQGNASISMLYSYRAKAGEDYSDFMTADEIIGKTAQDIRFKHTRTVTEIDGNDSVTVGKVVFTLTEDANAIVFGDTADLFTVTKNYFLPLRYCAVIVKHEALNGAGLKAFAKFDPSRYTAEKRQIGIGDGSGYQQTFTLPTTKYFKPTTMRVFIDDVETTDFYCNSDDNIVKVIAPKDAIVTASYTYRCEEENWIELAADPTQHDFSDGLFVTRYHCPDVTKYGNNVQVSAIRLQFIRGENNSVPRVHSFTAGWAT